MIEEPHRCVQGAETGLLASSAAERRRPAHAPSTAAGLITRARCPLQPARHRVLPLNQICAGTLRALRLMMADVEGAAGVARAAPTTDAPALGPPGVVAVPSSAADDSFKPPVVETVVQLSGPGSVPTTARPASPGMPDACAGGLL